MYMQGNEINTVEELAQSNMLWYSHDAQIAKPIENDPEYYYKKVHSNFRVENQENLIKIGKKMTGGIAVTRSSLSKIISFDEYVNEDIIHNYRGMRHTLYNHYTTLYIHKHSPHLDPFWEFAQRVISAGLIYYWEQESMTKTDDIAKQRLINYKIIGTEFEKLTMTHVQGIFVSWAFGIILSALVFIKEMIEQKKQFKQ